MLQFVCADGRRSRRRFDLKKQTKIQKLVLKKETMVSLQDVTGGLYLNDTVYRPAPTEYRCATDGCGYA
jgi:hypothetical protein